MDIIIIISNLICLAWAAEMPSREILIFSGWPEKAFSKYYLGLSLSHKTIAPLHLFQNWQTT